MLARGPTAKKELDDVFSELQELYGRIGSVQQELRDRLREEQQ